MDFIHFYETFTEYNHDSISDIVCRLDSYVFNFFRNCSFEYCCKFILPHRSFKIVFCSCFDGKGVYPISFKYFSSLSAKKYILYHADCKKELFFELTSNRKFKV